jgi:hypothetical protein
MSMGLLVGSWSWCDDLVAVQDHYFVVLRGVTRLHKPGGGLRGGNEEHLGRSCVAGNANGSRFGVGRVIGRAGPKPLLLSTAQ